MKPPKIFKFDEEVISYILVLGHFDGILYYLLHYSFFASVTYLYCKHRRSHFGMQIGENMTGKYSFHARSTTNFAILITA